MRYVLFCYEKSILEDKVFSCLNVPTTDKFSWDILDFLAKSFNKYAVFVVLIRSNIKLAYNQLIKPNASHDTEKHVPICGIT